MDQDEVLGLNGLFEALGLNGLFEVLDLNGSSDDVLDYPAFDTIETIESSREQGSTSNVHRVLL
jgi:hypothetical protein